MVFSQAPSRIPAIVKTCSVVPLPKNGSIKVLEQRRVAISQTTNNTALTIPSLKATFDESSGPISQKARKSIHITFNQVAEFARSNDAKIEMWSCELANV